MQTLEQSLDQKEKLIEKLTKEAMTRSYTQSKEIEKSDQIDTLNISIKELNEKLDLKNKEIQDYQNEIYDLKDELESFRTQLMRKDSHVNSLELSLTQKNEEIEMIEEKLLRLTKQQQQQIQISQSNNTLIEIEGLKKQCMTLQKEVQSKEIQIQQLTTELITLKELIDDFEEQKLMLKSKLEQQQAQFIELEKHFEQTSNDFEYQFGEQRQSMDEAVKIYEEKLKTCNEELERAKNSLKNESVKEDIELNERLNDLTAQIELKEVEKKEFEVGLSKKDVRIRDLEEALRESVAITAERELVLAQQKKKTEKIEKDVRYLQ